MKKIISILLTVLIATAAIHSFAAGSEPTIIVSNGAGTNGDVVDVTISLENNPGIAMMRLFVEYDTSSLTLKTVTDAGKLGTKYHSDQLKSPYVLMWDAFADTDTIVNDTLVTLSFEISASAVEKQYPITVTYGEYDIINISEEEIPFSISNGSITVTSGGGDDDGEPSISAADSVVLGETITATLTGTSAGGKVIGAMFDSEGNMIECHLYEPAATVSIAFEKSGGEYAEIYWWKDMTSIVPACENKIVAIKAAS